MKKGICIKCKKLKDLRHNRKCDDCFVLDCINEHNKELEEEVSLNERTKESED